MSSAPFAVASPASLHRQRFTLIVNAVPGSARRSDSRRIKASMIRKTAAELQYRYLSLWVEADHLVWLHGPAAGISFARQIETHIEHSEEIDETLPGMVVIQLDQHVYLAEIQRGAVSREAVLVPAAAEQRLVDTAKSATTIYTTDSGVRPVDLTAFNPVMLSLCVATHARRNPYRFGPMWRTLLAHGLFHPTQVLLLGGPLAVAMGLIGGAFLYPEYVREQAQAVIQAKQRELAHLAAQERQRLLSADADHSAAPNLRRAATALHQARLLGGDGLETLQMDPQRLTLTGKTDHFPDRVAAAVLREHWTHTLTPSGWALSRASGFERDPRTTRARAAALRPATWQLARSVSAALRIDRIERKDDFESLTFTLNLPRTNRLALLRLADAMYDRPYQLLRLDCQFSHWQLKACSAQFRAKYQTGKHHESSDTKQTDR